MATTTKKVPSEVIAEKQDEKAQDDFAAMRKKMAGKTSIVLSYDGVDYTLKFPRAVVKEMEAEGITADSIIDMSSVATLTGQEYFIEHFVARAFETEQPDLELDKVIEIYASCADKQELMQYLIMLFMQPILALTTDPTKTRAKFRLV